MNSSFTALCTFVLLLSIFFLTICLAFSHQLRCWLPTSFMLCRLRKYFDIPVPKFNSSSFKKNFFFRNRRVHDSTNCLANVSSLGMLPFKLCHSIYEEPAMKILSDASDVNTLSSLTDLCEPVKPTVLSPDTFVPGCDCAL